MPYRRFLFFNALGGLVWGVTFCLVGYLAGNSYHVVERRVGTAGAVVSVVVVVGGLIAWHLGRRRREAAEEAVAASDDDPVRAA